MTVGVVIEYCIAVCIGLFWTPLLFASAIWNYIKDPSQRWGCRVRKERPECLKSTEDWTHNLVSLQHEEIKLHYVSAGAPHKPLMILLHGFPEIWYSWRHQLRYFKEKYRVVAISMRGYGDSDSPTAVDRYKVSTLVADVQGVIRSLGAKECILAGHDWGGAVAWHVAAECPELVSRLIILNCPHSAVFAKVLRSSMKQFLMSFYMFFFQIPYLPEYYITRFDLEPLKKMIYSFDGNSEDVEAYVYYFSQKGAFRGPINYYRAAFRYRPAVSNTKKLSMPVLIIWGTDDLALTEPMAALSAEYCEDVTIKKIPGGSHFIQQHRPDDVNAYMEEFLDGQPASKKRGTRGKK